ncbi:mannitol dehydrogenase family protein [Vibrio viridaestus]|uniref:Mannitol dehydrogenase family protein n=1 Tax=Vibrio viridaestus TaxID=2487322 RepID=A0A3N9U8Q0_9VIBR|nr:mannitol dehydrogenase family protein [Vibrio viridaestus]RQW64586.1 mannitol dehydrogenase family protein [Vibrio viridaestus]
MVRQREATLIHIGCGAFFRAHQAKFTSELNLKSDTDWKYCVISMRNGSELLSRLKRQSYRYHLLEHSNVGKNLSLIDVINECLSLVEDGIDAIVKRLCVESVAVVSLTISEKAYYIDPSSGQLDSTHSDIVHDIANPAKPKTVIGLLVRSLQLRRDTGVGAFTVMSCDNLSNNGKVLKAAITKYALLVDPSLADWIESEVRFPCTMVDRIVPAPNETTFEDIRQYSGVYDPCSVSSESFKQWVIEESFSKDRPQWESVGAQLVKDVKPYEELKLRLLNGSHSFLAYLGYLAGYETVDAAITNPVFRSAVKKLMLEEQAETLFVPDHVDLNAYADELVERFANPNLKHKTYQIAMDGSQKLAPRILTSLAIQLQRKGNYELLCLAVAGWMLFVGGVDEDGLKYTVQDPMSEKFAMIYKDTKTDDDIVRELLSISTIFPADLSNNELLLNVICGMYRALKQDGVVKTIHSIVKKSSMGG